MRSIMLAFGLVVSLVVSLSVVDAHAVCVDKPSPKLETEINKAASSFLDGHNKNTLPDGLPEGEYETRKVKSVTAVNGNALVFLSFAHKKEEFAAVYSYKKGSNDFRTLVVGDLGNNDSRFWKFSQKVAKKCNKPTVQVVYDACLACGAGAGLIGKFIFDDGKWHFEQDSGNSEKLNEPDTEID